MRRREFTTLIDGAATWPLAVGAQQPAMPVIGFLNFASPDEYQPMVTAFPQGLQESGYVDGRSVTIAYRWQRVAMSKSGRCRPMRSLIEIQGLTHLCPKLG